MDRRSSKELGRHGYLVSSGTIYLVLHELEGVGSLSCTESIAVGKVRKSYAITDEGNRALAEAKEKIGELVEEVVDGEELASLPDVEAAHSEGNHNEL